MASSKGDGPQFDELRQIALDHFWPHVQQVADFQEPGGLQIMTEGKGCWVEDIHGNKYFDLVAGNWLENIGYGRTEIAEAIREQLRHINYAPDNTTSIPTLKLVEKLASLAPDKESRIFLVTGGSEANETALKMAKKYHRLKGEPGRYKVISRKGGYHGGTLATISLIGKDQSGFNDYGPLMPGSVHVTQPYHYRCLYCSDLPECNLECARDVERAIEHEGPKTVAAVIGEPISTAACMVPHPEYWPTLRSTCDKYGVLLLIDEVVTGFGRTGKMFACENWDLQPDIISVAKGLSSGYMPIAATIARKEIADAFIGEEEKTFQHIFTFGGHPAACVGALANIEIMENEGLVQNSAEVGQYLYEQLGTLYEHPIVGDIRGGLGLMCAIEFVKDRDTKEKIPKESNFDNIFTRSLRRHGLNHRQRGELLYILPPLCMTRDEVDFVVRQLNDVLSEVEKELERV